MQFGLRGQEVTWEEVPRCFVANYLEKHPEELKKTDLFYLAVIDKPQTSVWYKKTLMGKNDNKTMKKKSRLKDFCPEKKLTDHSVRQDQSEEIEKLQYSKMWDQKHNGSKLWARFRWLRVWWWKWTVNHVQHHRQCQVCFHFKTSSPSSSASSHVYNFSPCNATLNVAGNHSLQSSLSQSKWAYKGNMFQDSDSDWAVFCSNKSIQTIFLLAEMLHWNELCFLEILPFGSVSWHRFLE